MKEDKGGPDASRFAPGDVVCLRGTVFPKMVVQGLDVSRVQCVWHDAGCQLNLEWIQAVVLVRGEP